MITENELDDSFLTMQFNIEGYYSRQFPCTMKLTNLTPVYKKGNQSEKGNYQPVGILPSISKVFERCTSRYLNILKE